MTDKERMARARSHLKEAETDLEYLRKLGYEVGVRRDIIGIGPHRRLEIVSWAEKTSRL